MSLTRQPPAPVHLPSFWLAAALLVVGAATLAHGAAASGAIVDNGVIQLGINDLGDLNVQGGTPSSGEGTTAVGLRYLPTNAESTAPGCLCEGWGASYDGVFGGGADVSVAPQDNVTVVSFSASAHTAVSVVDLFDLRVTHDYHPSTATRYLYEATVTLENRGSVAHNDVRYRRVMDWDIEPTAFSEFVTIRGGSPTAANLLYTSDNGFAHPNPQVAPGSHSVVGPPPASADVVDNGPDDHGALFDFGFGTLAPGASRTFRIYYGAAGDEATLLAALANAGVEVYSLGEPNTPDGARLGTPNTFAFGFGGVGGEPLGQCRGHTKYGQAYVARVGLSDVGNTGLLGPTDVTVVERGPYAQEANLTQEATAANTSGPLLSAIALRSRVEFRPCVATAMAEVAEAASGPALPNPPSPVEALAVQATSVSSCGTRSGSVTLARLAVAGHVLLDTATQPPPNTAYQVGPVTVILNEQILAGDNFTVNAIHAYIPGAVDVVIASATSGITGCDPVVLHPGCSYAIVADTQVPPCTACISSGSETAGATAGTGCEPCVTVLVGPAGRGIPAGGVSDLEVSPKGRGEVVVDCRGPCVSATVPAVATKECLEPPCLKPPTGRSADAASRAALGTAGLGDCLPLPCVSTLPAVSSVRLAVCLPCVSAGMAAILGTGCVACDLAAPACVVCVTAADGTTPTAASGCAKCLADLANPACIVCSQVAAAGDTKVRVCAPPFCATAASTSLDTGFESCAPPCAFAWAGSLFAGGCLPECEVGQGAVVYVECPLLAVAPGAFTAAIPPATLPTQTLLSGAPPSA